MDLTKFSLEDLLLAAMKAEIESRTLYRTLASKVNNAFLKDRLIFLASEEDKHREFIQTIFEGSYPGKEPKVPKVSPVPMPSIVVDETSPHVSVLIEKAMTAERIAKQFYKDLAKRFKGDSAIWSTIRYLAIMEEMHYKMLELELERLQGDEDFIIDWPLMHAGP